MAWVASRKVFLPRLRRHRNLGCLLGPTGVTARTRNTLKERLFGRTQQALLVKNVREKIKSPLSFNRYCDGKQERSKIWFVYEKPIVKVPVF